MANGSHWLPGVKDLRIGDAVFGLAPGCFGPSVVLPADLMVQMPPGLTFTEAATLPTVFVTVFEAFGMQGLQSGQKVCLNIIAILPETPVTAKSQKYLSFQIDLLEVPIM